MVHVRGPAGCEYVHVWPHSAQKVIIETGPEGDIKTSLDDVAHVPSDSGVINLHQPF